MSKELKQQEQTADTKLDTDSPESPSSLPTRLQSSLRIGGLSRFPMRATRDGYNIPAEAIRIKPEEVTVGQTPLELASAKKDKITTNLQQIEAAGNQALQQKQQEDSSQEWVCVYRFYNPRDPQALLPKGQNLGGNQPSSSTEELATRHADSNDQSNSPFVSTTASLSAFVNTSFAPHLGDTNIKNDVIQRSPAIGIFIVPRDLLVQPQSRGDQDQPAREQELLFDARRSTQPLETYRMQTYHNPLEGYVMPDLPALALSRRVQPRTELYMQSTNLQKPPLPADTPITQENIAGYQQFLQANIDLDNRLGSIPREEVWASPARPQQRPAVSLTPPTSPPLTPQDTKAVSSGPERGSLRKKPSVPSTLSPTDQQTVQDAGDTIRFHVTTQGNSAATSSSSSIAPPPQTPPSPSSKNGSPSRT